MRGQVGSGRRNLRGDLEVGWKQVRKQVEGKLKGNLESKLKIVSKSGGVSGVMLQKHENDGKKSVYNVK